MIHRVRQSVERATSFEDDGVETVGRGVYVYFYVRLMEPALFQAKQGGTDQHHISSFSLLFVIISVDPSPYPNALTSRRSISTLIQSKNESLWRGLFKLPELSIMIWKNINTPEAPDVHYRNRCITGVSDAST